MKKKKKKINYLDTNCEFNYILQCLLYMLFYPNMNHLCLTSVPSIAIVCQCVCVCVSFMFIDDDGQICRYFTSNK